MDQFQPAHPVPPKPQGLEAWLNPDALLERKERADRLAMDAEVIAHLRTIGFIGPDWLELANPLSEYGIGVLMGWMRAGVIYEKLQEKNLRALRLDQSVLNKLRVREQIATTAVGEALRVFQTDILPNGRWKPEKGASVSTYFIGQCLIRFGNAVREWRRESGAGIPVEDEDLEYLYRRYSHVTSVEDDVIRNETAELILKGVSSARNARILAMAMRGYKPREIAEDMGLSVTVVSNVLSRERAKARQTLGTPGQGRGTA